MHRVTAGRILLVDDSELISAMVGEVLGGQGWEVKVATNGVEALEVLEGFGPDTVVCDLHMPFMDGFEVLQHVAEIDEDLPVIILSSDSDVSAVLGAVRRGAFDYVLKSDVGPLLASIERAAAHFAVVKENRRLTRELARLGKAGIGLQARETLLAIRADAEKVSDPAGARIVERINRLLG